MPLPDNSTDAVPEEAGSPSLPLPQPDIVVGVCFTALALVCIVPNITLNRTIWRDKDLFKYNAYKFVFAIGLCDIMQLVLHALSGIFMIFPSTYNHTISKIMGAFIIPAYIAFIVVNFVLSCNRLTQLCYPALDSIFFSRRAMKLWYAFSAFVFGGFCVALLSPWSAIVYVMEEYGWNYDDDYAGSIYVRWTEAVVEISGMYISCVIYVIVFARIIAKRKKYSAKTNYKTDVKILIQASVTTFCNTANDICWQNYTLLFGDSVVWYAVLNFMWVTNCAVNPLIYYLLNSSKSKASSRTTLSNRTQMGSQIGPMSFMPSSRRPMQTVVG